jgi:hypothetical protein
VENRVPTTDEMDSTTPEDRYKLVAFCLGCFEWHFFTGSKDRFLQLQGEVCQCGSKQFAELRSQRTWNAEWAKTTGSKLKTKALKARRK